MKFFANKNIWKKLVIILVIIIFASFIMPKPVKAWDLGGELMKPICQLVLGLGDGIMRIVHNLILHQNLTLLRVTAENGLLQVIQAIIWVVAIICVLIVCSTGVGIIAGSATMPAAISALATVGTAMMAKTAKGLVVAAVLCYAAGAFTEEIDLPLYSITPEEIFKDKIPAFNVNFISPPKDVTTYHEGGSGENLLKGEVTATEMDSFLKDFFDGKSSGETLLQDHTTKSDMNTFLNKNLGNSIDIDYFQNNGNKIKEDSRITSYEIQLQNGKKYKLKVRTKSAGASKDYSLYETTNATGLTGMDIQYFKDNGNEIKEDERNTSYEIALADGEKYILKVRTKTSTSASSAYSLYQISETDTVVEEYTLSYTLQKIISKWYNILRIIAIVGMMSVLVYIGIRIVISSTAGQKAKYKELVKDWLIGMVLLFTMHYIMNFANVFTAQLTNIFSSVNPIDHVQEIEDVIGEEKTDKNSNLIKKALEENNVDKVITEEGKDKVLWSSYTDSETGKEMIEWHTNLMGAIRIKANAYNVTDDAHIGYTIMFTVMVIYTIIFIWTYLRRVIYMAFLTIIAPLVALTYPIDKANDGKAQGFDMWFKEYVFNLLLQPMHLLLYTVLISSAIELASKNWVYSLVAIGFMATAEKIVRQMFNFEKARTPGAFAGPAGIAFAIEGMRRLVGRVPDGGQGKSGGYMDSGSKDEDGRRITSARTKTDIPSAFENIDMNSSELEEEQKKEEEEYKIIEDTKNKKKKELENKKLEISNRRARLNQDNDFNEISNRKAVLFPDELRKRRRI